MSIDLKSTGTVIKTGRDSFGRYFVLDKTKFFPEENGLSSDIGTVLWGGGSAAIPHVARVDREIRHYAEIPRNQDFQYVTCHLEIDANKRHQNARLHTAGHMIGHLCEILDASLTAVNGIYFPDNSYVEFLGVPSTKNISGLITGLTKAAQRAIQVGYPVKNKKMDLNWVEQNYTVLSSAHTTSAPAKTVNTLFIEHLGFAPAEGPHTNSLREIKGFKVTKIQTSGKRTKVIFQIPHDS